MNAAVVDPVTAAKLAAHEQLCEVRHNAINATLGEIKETIKDAARGAIGLAVALIVFLAGQLWTIYGPSPISSAQAQTVSH